MKEKYVVSYKYTSKGKVPLRRHDWFFIATARKVVDVDNAAGEVIDQFGTRYPCYQHTIQLTLEQDGKEVAEIDQWISWLRVGDVVENDPESIEPMVKFENRIINKRLKDLEKGDVVGFMMKGKFYKGIVSHIELEEEDCWGRDDAVHIKSFALVDEFDRDKPRLTATFITTRGRIEIERYDIRIASIRCPTCKTLH